MLPPLTPDPSPTHAGSGPTDRIEFTLSREVGEGLELGSEHRAQEEEHRPAVERQGQERGEVEGGGQGQYEIEQPGRERLERQAPEQGRAQAVGVEEIRLEKRILPGLERGSDPPDVMGV